MGLDGIFSKIAKFKRKAFLPITAQGDSGPLDSKFSGIPFLEEGEKWPVCPNCKKPMQLFLQLNLDEAKKQTKQDCGSGLFQLFYCTSDTEPRCDTVCDGNVPEGTCELVRVIIPKGKPQNIVVPKLEPNQIKPVKITGWMEVEEFPSGTEIQELNLDEKIAEDYELIEKIDDENNTIQQKDKLGGWPFWIQSPWLLECKKCGKPMQLFFQLCSQAIPEASLDYFFCDGIGYIFQCPQHKEEVVFFYQES
ncbi:MAG: DUF1963 domain-containing protein [Candidatus Diapherotrites archaeon]|nr:DUF1963 domain-containing protein [Candidatus Diapherotrites archaeon]